MDNSIKWAKIVCYIFFMLNIVMAMYYLYMGNTQKATLFVAIAILFVSHASFAAILSKEIK